MRKLVLIFLVLLLSNASYAFHLIGGEFELVYLESFRYRLTLVTYFDQSQSTNPAPENFADVSVFSNATHSFIETFELDIRRLDSLAYVSEGCELDQLQITKVTYTQEIILDPDKYSDPAGYYIVWERCCRNANIVNIVSPLNAGNTIVMDFPSLVENNELFINSSPVFGTPEIDYACVGRFFQNDLRAFDSDGDSLGYQIMVPLNSSSATPLPPPTPKTFHQPVTVPDGISAASLIPGSPSLTVSTEGILTVQPTQPGLYAYAVQVTEYRDGVAIGNVIRDYQLLVVDECENFEMPRSYVAALGSDYTPEDTLQLDYSNASEFCISWAVGSEGQQDLLTEIIPINFSESELTEFLVTETPINSDSLLIEVCLPECSFREGEELMFDLLATVDVCPRPFPERIHVSATLPDNENVAPTFTTADVVQEVELLQSFSLELVATDADKDNLQFTLYNPNSELLSDLGVSLEDQSSVPGEIRSLLQWDATCETIDILDGEGFNIAVVVTDFEKCRVLSDTLRVNLGIMADPMPSFTEQFTGLDTLFVTAQVDELYSRTFEAVDPDGDDIIYRVSSTGVDKPSLEELGMEFEQVSDGDGMLSVTMTWTPTCDVFSYASSEELANGAVSFGLNMVIDDDTCLPWEDLIRMVITVESDCSVTEVASLANDFEILQVSELGFQLQNPPAGASIDVYDLSGRRYVSEVIREGHGKVYIKTNLTRNRIYLLKVGYETFKLRF